MNINNQHRSKAHVNIHKDSFNHRTTFFSRFDEGIQFDKSSLYTVKPEVYALRNAKYFKGKSVLDLCCGIGGTTIGFARSGKKVLAVDSNKKLLTFAMKNSRIYNVNDRIDFQVGDVNNFEYPDNIDAAFIDPPWGSPVFLDEEVNFEDFFVNLYQILSDLVSKYSEVGCTVPQEFDLSEFKKIQCKKLIILKENISNLPSTKVYSAFFYQNA